MDELFSKYQKQILAFANTKFGRSYLGASIDLPISHIHPGATAYSVDKIKRVADVYTGDPHAKSLGLALVGLDEAVKSFGFIKEYFEKPDLIIPHFMGLITPRPYLPRVMFSTDVYSDGDPESTSVDGNIGTSGYPSPYTSWASAMSSAGTSNDSATNIYVGCERQANGGDNRYALWRGYMLYNTGVLNIEAVSAAAFRHYLTQKNAAMPVNTMYIVGSNPASNTALTTADYAITKTDYGNFAFGSRSTSAWYEDALNATGRSVVSKTGITKLGLTHSYDFSGTTPPNNDTTSNIYFNTGDNASNKHSLRLTYTEKSSGSPMLFGGGVTIG